MLTGIFTACSSDSDSLAPILPDGEIGGELNAYFEENLQMIASSIFSKNDAFLGKEERAIMINSLDDFTKIDFIDNAPMELPAINFESYTLIIGDYFTPGAGYSLVDQSIVVKSQKTTVYIRVKQNENTFAKPTTNPFWGLYPKLPQGSVNVVRK